jgi:soluble lytic murein transglycosylase
VLAAAASFLVPGTIVLWKPAQAQSDLDALVQQVRRTDCQTGLDALASRAAGSDLEARRASYLHGWCLARTGRYAHAAEAFRAAAGHATLRPHAVVAQAAAVVKAGRPGEATAILGDEAGRMTGRLRARALAALAEAEMALGRPGRAVDLLSAAVEIRPGEPETWARLAEAARAAGRRPTAQRALAHLGWAFPGHPDEQQARDSLARLLGRPVRPGDIPAQARLERGRQLHQEGEWDQARAELKAVTAALTAGPLAGEAWYRLGELSLATDPRASHAAFRRAAALGWQPAGAYYWAAVAARRAGRQAEAQEAMSTLVRIAPSSTWAARAWLEAGLRAEGGGRAADAAAHYRRAAAAAPDSHWAAEARWRQGWMAHGAGRGIEAEARFREAAQAAPSAGEAARAWYWMAKTKERRGDPSFAATLRMVAEQYPLAFYGQRARQRLGLTAPALPPPPAGSIHRDIAGPAHEELARLGFDDEAAAIAEEMLGDAQSASRDPRLVRFLAEAYSRLAEARLRPAESRGYPARMHRHLGAYWMSVAFAEEALHAGQRDEGVWRLAYPRAFWSEVRTAAGAAGVDPLLLLALVREESRYDPAAISPARAVGLTQLLVPTARAITSDPTLDVARLQDPALNLRLGARYLRLQIDRFAGDLRLALAAYNAGPAAARRWADLDADPDYFIEKIGYAETRAFVRRVLGSHGIYRLLW